MATIKAGVSDPTNTFNLNGLDYKKGIYEIYYNGVEVDSSGNIDESKVKVGIRNQHNVRESIQYPQRVSDYKDGVGTPYSSLNDLITDLVGLLGFNSGSGAGYESVEFRADLPTTLVDPAIGTVYLVEKPTTILFGTYTTYQSGLYIKDADTGSLNDWRRLNMKNKYLDTEFFIADDVDQSKQFTFQASGITPSTVRVQTVQDKDGVLAHLADVPEKASQAEVDAKTDDTKFVTPLKLENSQRFDEFKQPLSTGFRGTPPVLTINGGDNTKFDLSAGIIVHVDSSTNPPTVTETSFGPFVAVTPTFLASETASFISIDVNGAIVQRPLRATPQQRRETASVGLVSHVDNLIIDSVVNTPVQNIDAVSQTHDVIRALGFFSTSGNQISGNTGTLTIDKKSGTGFALNENAATNPKDPHNISMAGLFPAVMFQILQDATVISISSVIDPTIYDNGGVSTVVPSNNNATISYVYAFPNNSIVYLIGQEVFATFADAKAAAGSETVVLPPDIAQGALLLARVILKKSATDITDSSEAFILPAASIASGGSSLTSLQEAYDISVEPEIITDSTRGAVTIQRGSALDTDNIIEGKNGAGSVTSNITGEGDATFNNITPNGLVDGRDIAADGALLDTAEQTANKGAVNGYASLDGSGKIPSSQLPTNMMEYEGDWNASTNTPTLANTDTDKKGTVYRVNVAGTVDFGAGNITFAVGDWCYNNGSTWERSDEQTIPDTDALPEGSTNLYYTEARVSANVDVAANTTHRTSDGSDHTFIDQDVTSGSSPTFNGSNFTNLAAGADTQIQYNNAGNLGATANMVWDSTSNCFMVIGCIDNVHTALESDDHGIQTSTNAAGFGDVKAINISYITGNIGLGDEEGVILANIDESASTGAARIVGYEVISTDQGSADVYHSESGAGVSPILQQSGTFADADSILVLAADQTTALSSGGAGNISIFVADNDTITIGSSTKFEEIEFIIDTFASGSGVAPTFEYSTGVGTWASFTPTDGTNGFRNNGIVLWSDTDIPSWAVGTGSEYLIRITRTRNTLATTPILDLVQIAAVVEYKWDKNGDLDIRQIQLDDQDASPVADRRLRVIDGVIRSADTSNVEGRYISKSSIEKITTSEIADGTDGELITWDASGVATTVGAGTSGQVLTSNGAGAAPTFQNAAGGGGLDIDRQIAISTANQTRTATGFADINGMTLTSPNDGVTRDYIINFNCDYMSDVDGGEYEIVINVGGSDVVSTERMITGQVGAMTATTQHYATNVAPNTIIKVRFRSVNSDEITMQRRSLIIDGIGQ
jgi:hypothetical protein